MLKIAAIYNGKHPLVSDNNNESYEIIAKSNKKNIIELYEVWYTEDNKPDYGDPITLTTEAIEKLYNTFVVAKMKSDNKKNPLP